MSDTAPVEAPKAPKAKAAATSRPPLEGGKYLIQHPEVDGAYGEVPPAALEEYERRGWSAIDPADANPEWSRPSTAQLQDPEAQ